jgi:Tfp pilus assembly protein PilO
MSAGLSKLNLRPQERRLIALVAIVLFVVLNIVFVWPHFNDWGRLKLAQLRAERTLQTYQSEIAKSKAYNVKLRELESAGSSVLPEEQELDLVKVVDSQAQLNGLFLIQLDSRPKQSTTQTNRFFEEQYVTLHVTSDNEQLVNFLVSLTSNNSLIRVKDLTIKTADAAATKLDELMTLVASYQRKTPAKTQAPIVPTRTTNAVPAKTPGPRTIGKTNKPALSPTASVTNKTAIPRPRLTNQPARRP